MNKNNNQTYYNGIAKDGTTTTMTIQVQADRDHDHHDHDQPEGHPGARRQARTHELPLRKDEDKLIKTMVKLQAG